MGMRAVGLALGLLVGLLPSLLIAQILNKPASAQKAVGHFRIGKVIIEGNRRTSGRIIRRELGLVEDTLVHNSDSAALFRIEANKIFNTRLFVFVTVQTINYLPGPDTLTPGHADLHILVKERWYTWPSPILELADRSFNEWYYNRGANINRINYGMRIIQNNLTGNNDPLKLTLQGGFTKRIELSYAIPYINKRMNEGLSGRIAYATEKQIFIRTDSNILQNFKQDTGNAREKLILNLAYSYRKGYYQNHRWDLFYNHTSISPQAYAVNPAYFGDGMLQQNYFQAEYNYTLDRRNIRAFPLKGYDYNFEIEQLGLLKTDDVSILSARFSHGRYITMPKKWFYASRLDLGVSFPRRQPYSNWRALGYVNRFVRGYDKCVVEGNNGFVWKNSLRKRLFSTIKHIRHIPIRQFATIPMDVYLKSFADFGYMNNDLVQQTAGDIQKSNARLSNTLLVGTGVGIDIVTFYDAVVRFEYAINRNLERGFFFYLKADI